MARQSRCSAACVCGAMASARRSNKRSGKCGRKARPSGRTTTLSGRAAGSPLGRRPLVQGPLTARPSASARARAAIIGGNTCSGWPTPWPTGSSGRARKTWSQPASLARSISATRRCRLDAVTTTLSCIATPAVCSSASPRSAALRLAAPLCSRRCALESTSGPSRLTWARAPSAASRCASAGVISVALVLTMGVMQWPLRRSSATAPSAASRPLGLTRGSPPYSERSKCGSPCACMQPAKSASARRTISGLITRRPARCPAAGALACCSAWKWQ